MKAPAPTNLRAMSDAWDNPTAFARELANYYSQLETTGHRTPAIDRTEAAHAAESETTHGL